MEGGRSGNVKSMWIIDYRLYTKQNQNMPLTDIYKGEGWYTSPPQPLTPPWQQPNGVKLLERLDLSYLHRMLDWYFTLNFLQSIVGSSFADII